MIKKYFESKSSKIPVLEKKIPGQARNDIDDSSDLVFIAFVSNIPVFIPEMRWEMRGRSPEKCSTPLFPGLRHIA